MAKKGKSLFSHIFGGGSKATGRTHYKQRRGWFTGGKTSYDVYRGDHRLGTVTQTPTGRWYANTLETHTWKTRAMAARYVTKELAAPKYSGVPKTKAGKPKATKKSQAGPTGGTAALAGRLERGEVSGDELAELMRKGIVRRRNPHSKDLVLSQAVRMAESFHGTADGQIIELSEKQRKLPKRVVAIGTIPELVYTPKRGSSRAGYTYEHKSGDRGFLRKESKKKPLLAADPRTGRPIIVPNGSGMRLTGEGLIG